MAIYGSNNQEVCGTCKYNKYAGGMFYCDNEDSTNYGCPNDYDDTCEDWEDKDE